MKKDKNISAADNKSGASIIAEEKIHSPFRTAMMNFFAKKLSVAGIIMFSVIFLSCIVLPIFVKLDKSFQDPTQQNKKPGFNFMSVPSALKNNALQIDGGSSFGIGIDNDNKVYTWGQMTNRLKDMPKDMGSIVQVSAGLDHFVALSKGGEVYTWGSNRFRLDILPEDLYKYNIIQVEAGYQISGALDSDGVLHIWGNESLINIVADEVQGRIKEFHFNTTTAIALLDDGTVRALTRKDTPFNRLPEDMDDYTITHIATTDSASAAISEEGKVFVWGNKTYDVYDIPEGVQGHAVQISAGRNHFTVLLDDGTVAAWGDNRVGQAKAPKLSNIVSVQSSYYQNYAIDDKGKVYAWGLKGYLMGTDQFGREVLVRLLSGGRISLTVGAISVLIEGILGILVGGISGFYGGKVDIFLMRVCEIVSSIPFLPIAIILSVVIGNKIPDTGRVVMIMFIIGFLGWPGLARLTRGQILAERENEFVTAAKAMGIREISIIFRHILPNVMAVVLVNLTLGLAASMLTESSLSFIGFGVTEPTPTWGNMLTSCVDSIVIRSYWWRWVFPSLALAMATISINLIGDGLRDAIDPKSNDR